METFQSPKLFTTPKVFYHLLGNTLIATVTNMTVWFALTFFVYLETRSVFATAIVAGIYLVAVTLSGFWFGSLVDHYKKKVMMQLSSLASLVFYVLGLGVYFLAPEGAFKDPASVVLWVFVVLLMLGVVVGNIRGIALPTLVTILFPEDRRDKANGLVGTASGIAFLVVSVISGLLVGFWGMGGALLVALVATGIVMAHLATLAVPEHGIVHAEGQLKVDIRGTFQTIAVVPGLLALILFTTFNNFLSGIYMALMDAYGLSLVSVQAWGILWGIVSVGFIVGGLIIAKRGLGKNPLRSLFIANIIIWIVSSIFTLQSSVILLSVGLFIFLTLSPFIEAAEQTIIQRVVPLERQGRVFGFAQSVEMAASPLTAFMIGPIAQFIFIPFMTNGAGVDLIGSWFGTGADRGIALVFVLTGIVGLLITLIAMSTRYYRLLSDRYLSQPNPVEEPANA
jgi:DHA3 family multidrug efflux protein-like MFS transporter